MNESNENKKQNISKIDSLKEEIKNNFNPEYFQHYFREIQGNARNNTETVKLEKEIINLSVSHYAKKLDVSEKTARGALLDIVVLTEEELNPQKTLKKVLFAIRQLSPKVNGIINRENDITLSLQQIHHKLERLDQLEKQKEDLRVDLSLVRIELEKQKEIYLKTIKTLKEHTPPSGVWKKIKWIFKRN